jgi:hypothetical protein
MVESSTCTIIFLRLFHGLSIIVGIAHVGGKPGYSHKKKGCPWPNIYKNSNTKQQQMKQKKNT